MSLRSTVLLLLLLSGTTLVLSQPVVTLRLVDWAGPDEMKIDKDCIAAFRQRYPQIDVRYEPNPGRQYEEKILTGLAASAPPDVFLLDSKLIPTFVGKNVLLDLTPFVHELDIDTAQWFSNVTAIARRGDRLYAFPKGFTPLMFFYNKQLFDRAGVQYPSSDWTWQEYLEIAKTLTRDDDKDGVPEQYGAAFTNYYFYWIPWVWSAGGDVLSPDGSTAVGFLNSRPTEAALQFPIDLRRTHRVAPDVGSWIQAEKTGSNYALFAAGKIGMILDGHWRMPTFLRHMNEGRLRVGVAPFPISPGSEKVNVIYESGWCVPAGTAHPREAVLLAAFMAGEEACRIRAAAGLELPANKVVAAEMVRNDQLGLEKTFLDEVPFCRQPWGSLIERFSEIEWTLQDAVDEVLLDGKPMHETMTRYAARVDAQLAEIRHQSETKFTPIKEHTEILLFLAGVSLAVFCGAAIIYLRTRRKNRKSTAIALGFLAPSLAHLIVWVFTPIVFAAYLSVHRWDVIGASQPFIGLGNFREIFSDPGFWNALKNTVVFTGSVPIGMTIALAIATVLNRNISALGFLRTLYFLPGVTSFVAIALVWMWIYHPSFGAANAILSWLGIGSLQWLNSTDTAMLALIVFSVWLGIGYQMVVFLAGLQSIPNHLYDAARIDGAGEWQRFIRITIPLLRPTTFFILVTSVIASFQVFTSVYMMTAGGPVGSTDVIVYHIYHAAWEQLRMGYAAAMSWILFLIVMILTWVQFRLFGRELEYS